MFLFDQMSKSCQLGVLTIRAKEKCCLPGNALNLSALMGFWRFVIVGVNKRALSGRGGQTIWDLLPSLNGLKLSELGDLFVEKGRRADKMELAMGESKMWKCGYLYR